MDIRILAFSVVFLFQATAAAAPAIGVDKSVDRPSPAAGEAVEFTVQVTNGGDQAAAGVTVFDRLPAEMAIPAGMAAFTSVGTWEPATGNWDIGTLEPGAAAVMTVPAMVTSATPPACIVNVASSTFDDGAGDGDDEARAAVRQPGIARCVDLAVDISLSSNPPFVFPSCDSTARYEGEVRVTNAGPDAARSVQVTIAQNPVVGPNLRFDDADCSSAPGAQCTLAVIPPRTTVTLDVTSDAYRSYEVFSQTISTGAGTSDADYDGTNNTLSVTGSGGGFSGCLDLDIPVTVGVPACFIATAAYGTPMDERLDTLRAFRDQRLLTNAPGRAFVRWYYAHSPPVAAWIAEHDRARAMVRTLLVPVIFVIGHPWHALLLVLCLSVSLMPRRWQRSRLAPETRP